MKRIMMTAIVVLLVSAPLAEGWADEARSGEVHLLLLVQQSYGANYNLVRDFMELYGWNLTTVGVTESVPACFWGGPIVVDTLASEIADVSAYDGVVVCHSRSYIADPYRQILDSPDAVGIVSAADAAGKLIVGFCAGTRVLAAADVIDGRQVTGKSAFEAEYVAAGATYVGEAGVPVQDGNIITCMRGQVNSERVCEVMRVALDSLRAVR